MATVNPTVVSPTEMPGMQDGSVIMYQWVLTSTNADGAPIFWAEFADRTVTANGTWGGATLTLQGTNDPAKADGNFVALNAGAGGGAATATADKAIQVIEVPLWFRPKLTTAGSGASVTVILLLRRPTPMRT